jgi:hypothetical protein
MSNLKTLVRGAYDIQKLRIQMGNRIVGNFKSKLGQKPGQKEDDLDAKGKMILNNLRASFKKITDGVKTFPRRASFKGDKVISNYTELCLLASYIALEKEEKTHFAHLKNVLADYKIFSQFLDGVKGVGPAMAGVIISEIDISKARHPSSLWKYAGLDVGADGNGRSRKKEHLVDSEYVDRAGEIKIKKGITFNPFLKTKLTGVLSASFLKVKESLYKDIYYNYKARLEQHPAHKDKTKGHRHNMAMRYLVKIFLIDLHREWRKLEGFPASVPYSEGKLRMVHGG